MAKLVLLTALVAALVASTAAARMLTRTADAAKRCPVSATSSRPGPGRGSFDVGNARLAVALPDGARFVAVADGAPGGGQAFVQKDGWIRTKLGWFSAAGAPRVTGRKVDGTGKRLRAQVGPLSYLATGSFYPSLLYFPSFGCWRITATAGNARLRAVVLVQAASALGVRSFQFPSETTSTVSSVTLIAVSSSIA